VTVRRLFSTFRRSTEFWPSACCDVVKKPKLDQHRLRCQSSFTCIDCSTTFAGPHEYKGHTFCVSEAQKYEKALYKGPKQDGVSSHLHCVLNMIRCSRALVSSPSGKINQLNSKDTTVGERDHGHTRNLNRDHTSAMDGVIPSNGVDGSSVLWVPEAMKHP